MEIRQKNISIPVSVNNLKEKKNNDIKDPVETIDVSCLTDNVSTREERISKSLAKTGMRIAQSTREFSTAYVGTLIGSAIGASVSIGGPLIAPAVGSAAGAIGGMLWEGYNVSDKIASLFKKLKHKKEEKTDSKGAEETGQTKSSSESSVRPREGNTPAEIKKDGNILTEGTEAIMKTMRAIPSFVYPSIYNATEAERELIVKTLDSLPLSDITTTPTIAVSNLEKLEASGVTFRRLYATPIELDKASIADKIFGREVLVHELGHSKDFAHGVKGVVGNASGKAPWGAGPYVFDSSIDVPGEPTYASTSKFEDFAQSHSFYHLKGEELKATSEAKYEAMKQLEQPGVVDKIMDRTGIREAGKKIGAAIEKVPGLRTTLTVAGAVMGPLEIRKGAKELEKGLEQGDKIKKFHGKMDLGSGILFTSKVFSPFGLLVSGEHWILNRKLKKGKITPETANKWADITLGAAGGPVGMATMATIKQLVGDTPIDLKGGKSDDFKTMAFENSSESNKNKKTVELAGTVIGGIGGAAAGSAIGSAIGMATGVMANSVVGGVLGSIVGGPVGVMAGSMAGTAIQHFIDRRQESKVELFGAKEKSDLTKEDKIYMGKVIGGGVLGGVVGTFAGSEAGGFVGSAIGGLIGGPTGSAVGHWVGKTALGMTGAYYGATLGGKVAKKIPGGDGQEYLTEI